MVFKCILLVRCGIVVMGWLSFLYLKMIDGIVNGKVCYSWELDCCKWD